MLGTHQQTQQSQPCHLYSLLTMRYPFENISLFMKGIFNLKPAFPRQSAVFDPDIVLDYLSTLEYDLLLKDL